MMEIQDFSYCVYGVYSKFRYIQMDVRKDFATYTQNMLKSMCVEFSIPSRPSRSSKNWREKRCTLMDVVQNVKTMVIEESIRKRSLSILQISIESQHINVMKQL